MTSRKSLTSISFAPCSRSQTWCSALSLEKIVAIRATRLKLSPQSTSWSTRVSLATSASRSKNSATLRCTSTCTSLSRQLSVSTRRYEWVSFMAWVRSWSTLSHQLNRVSSLNLRWMRSKRWCRIRWFISTTLIKGSITLHSGKFLRELPKCPRTTYAWSKDL